MSALIAIAAIYKQSLINQANAKKLADAQKSGDDDAEKKAGQAVLNGDP